MDDVGLYDPDATTQNPGQAAEAAQRGQSPYNFSYIDQIYDGLLANDIRPFVELSFMPKKMASDPAALHAFWYKPNVSPPKDYALWDAMITAFAQHLVDRYGIDEVSQLGLRSLERTQHRLLGRQPETAHLLRALRPHRARHQKSQPAPPRRRPLHRAGRLGRATSSSTAKQNNIPVDFVSTHVYANDTAKDVFGTDEDIPRDKMVCRAVRKVHDEIAASPLPNTPLIFSEYNASYANEPNVTDSVYMGPWLANTISQCDGLTEAMSYWTFSDVFEEQGVVRTPFYGGFGLHRRRQHPQARLQRLRHAASSSATAASKLDSDSALATRRSDGSLAIALWNYAPPFGTGATYTPPPPNTRPSKRHLPSS